MVFNLRGNIRYYTLVVSHFYYPGISNIKIFPSDVDNCSSWDWTSLRSDSIQPYHLPIDIIIQDHMGHITRSHEPYLVVELVSTGVVAIISDYDDVIWIRTLNVSSNTVYPTSVAVNELPGIV